MFFLPSDTHWTTDCQEDHSASVWGPVSLRVLAPFLFTLYTADLMCNSESWHIQKYSEDTVIVEGQCRKLTRAFIEWWDGNHLLLNITKNKAGLSSLLSQGEFEILWWYRDTDTYTKDPNTKVPMSLRSVPLFLAFQHYMEVNYAYILLFFSSYNASRSIRGQARGNLS